MDGNYRPKGKDQEMYFSGLLDHIPFFGSWKGCRKWCRLAPHHLTAEVTEAQRQEVACLGSQGPLFTSYSSQRFLLASVSFTNYPHSLPWIWRSVLITNGYGALLTRNCPLPGRRALVCWSRPSLYLLVPQPEPQAHPLHQGAVGGGPGRLRRVSPRPLEQLSHLLPACCLRSLNLPRHSRHNN